MVFLSTSKKCRNVAWNYVVITSFETLQHKIFTNRSIIWYSTLNSDIDTNAKKVKLSLYTPWEHMRGRDVDVDVDPFVLNIGTRGRVR